MLLEEEYEHFGFSMSRENLKKVKLLIVFLSEWDFNGRWLHSYKPWAVCTLLNYHYRPVRPVTVQHLLLKKMIEKTGDVRFDEDS